ncbi:MAG: GNAT family N-acetyltransferase [bacterium]|nr:GNAT family N-acetyltransferase [bacterium]
MIRRAKEEDYQGLQNIKPSISESTIKERLQAQAVGRVEFLVLKNSDKLVSFVLLKWGGKKTHPNYPDMEDLYTMESERGKGFGSQLVAECERLTKLKGLDKIGLAVNPTLNKPAKRLYEKLGYKPDGNPSYIDGVYDGVEDWCIDMEKSLK